MIRSLLPLTVLLVLSACGGGSDLGPPEGWTGEGTERWWRTDADTTGVFRNLDDLDAMGVTLRDDHPLAAEVQRGLVLLYRTEPRFVDSAFVTYGLPALREATFTGTPEEQVERATVTVYRTMNRYYRQAVQDPSVRVRQVYPDSLRARGASGTVSMQIRVDEQGRPVAIEKLSGADPTLDALAMRNVTEMRWAPAGFRGEPIPSWTRMELRYATSR